MSAITVIIPVFNTATYLPRCIESVINQDFTDFDLVLVNDGSTDESGALCRSFALKHSFIHIIDQKNQGLSAARNAGINWAIENSSSRYLAFIDSDDYVAPHYLSVLLNTIGDADLAMCNFTVEDENGNLLCAPQEIEPKTLNIMQFWDLYETSRLGYCAVAWNKLYKKTLFSSVRFAEGKFHEDQEILHKIISQVSCVSCSEIPAYFYVKRGGSITSNKTKEKYTDSIMAFLHRSIYLASVNDYGHAYAPLNRAIGEYCELSASFGTDRAIKKELLLAVRRVGSTQGIKTNLRWRLQLFCPRLVLYLVRHKER